MSSTLGLLNNISNNDIREYLIDPKTSIENISSILNQYVKATTENKQKTFGFPTHDYQTYSMSKVCLNAITLVQQHHFDLDETREDIIVNSCCPGYCDTDMSQHQGPLTANQGAETPVYLALLPPNISGPKGKFLKEKKVVDWQK